MNNKIHLLNALNRLDSMINNDDCPDEDHSHHYKHHEPRNNDRFHFDDDASEGVSCLSVSYGLS